MYAQKNFERQRGSEIEREKAKVRERKSECMRESVRERGRKSVRERKRETFAITTYWNIQQNYGYFYIYIGALLLVDITN